MKRRDFLRFGAAAAGAPALLPLLDLSGTRGRPGIARRADDPVRICYNENPLGVPDAAREAIHQGILDEGHQYPGAPNAALTDALAEHHGVDGSGIVLGNGSTDVLRMTVQSQAARHPSVRVVTAHPTFEAVGTYAEPFRNVEMVRIPLTEGSYDHDLGAMKAAAGRSAGAVLVYICNPNNPTPTVTSASDIRQLIDEAPDHYVFLVDEAYHHFAEDPAYETLDGFAFERPNVIVARTFSKIFGMAGCRVGYAIAHPRTAEQLSRLTVATCPNALGSIGARAALADRDYMRESLRITREGRRVAYETLDDLGLPYMESNTNFLMHRIKGDVSTYQGRMEEAGVLVGRPFPPYTDHNRVSIGTPEQMEQWAEVLRSFRDRGWV